MRYLTLNKWYKTDDIFYNAYYNILCDTGVYCFYSKEFFLTEREFYKLEFSKKIKKLIL